MTALFYFPSLSTNFVGYTTIIIPLVGYYILMKFLIQKRGEANFDTVRFADERCQEVWLTNVFLTDHSKEDSLLGDQIEYRIELHLYQGFTFVKFFLENGADDPKRYKMRGHESNLNIGLSDTKKLLKYCVDILKIYLHQNPDHFVGFIGEPDQTDDEKGLITPQRLRIYDTIISSYFQLPDYLIDRSELVSRFNMRLIRRCLFNNDVALVSKGQEENFRSLKYELSLREEEELLGMMTTMGALEYQKMIQIDLMSR